ncbi:MAG: carbohydrate binding domain-containing protein [Ruminococcus sp.]|nr:carbohydrate binding domain-containing protein [Ruminococcus sp.]
MKKRIISAVTAVAMSLAAVPSVIPFSNVSAAEIMRDTFDSGTNEWTGRGSAKVTASSDSRYEGTGALFVSGREDSWNGATKELGSEFSQGNAYSFSVNVMCPTADKRNLFHLTLQYNGSDGEAHYDKIASGECFGGDWIQLYNTSYTIPSDATDMYIYVETEKGTSDFYIDDFTAADEGTVIDGSGDGGKITVGDISGDGIISSFDVIAARKGVINGFAEGRETFCADVDGNGEANVADLVLLSEYVLGKISEFPQAEPIAPPKSDFNYESALKYHAAPDYYLNPAGTQGKVITENYNGINGGNKLKVYLPAGYDESKKYNIFYLMHGGGENENTIFSDDVKLNNILDHMIENGELEPMIVVTPTFNACTAQTFYNEFRQSVVPFVEGKYSTYAEDTSAEGIRASRMHRAYGGFSMGGVSTWAVMQNCLDMVGYFMPLSGDHWSGNSAQDKANSIAGAIDKSGLSQREYFIFAATGTDDIAHQNISPQIAAMKPMTDYYTYTSDFSQGNLYFLEAPGLTHWWGYVRHYVYDGLPYFFHEG